MEGLSLVFCALFVVTLFGFAYTTRASFLSQEYTNTPPTTPYTHVTFCEIVPFNKKSSQPTWEDQSQEWQEKMSELGQRMVHAKVGLVYFVHGTFAGDDPFGIVHAIRNAYPKLSSKLKKVNDYIKRRTDAILADKGNYLPEYVELFKKAISSNIPCERFIWSSENHHWGRLKEAMKFAENLAANVKEKKLSRGERVLLIGHSHAGQLFALLTNFLARSQGVHELLKVLVLSGVDAAQFDKALEVICEVPLDIVTFGTPPRYSWGKGNYRLLNIINHRGYGYLGGCMKGFLRTKDGDYIQQWGIAGTDIPALADNRLNKQLDQYLGTGFNINTWLKNIQARMRVPHYGETILVDYKDASLFFPNCTKTLFGHGVYTKFEKMLFNTQLIADTWYRKL
ncbi:MAG: hypothetical protein NG784_10515 [Candidatus Jettenia sp.]|nr:hypothetical protein [Candidatus Jettenia sp.]